MISDVISCQTSSLSHPSVWKCATDFVVYVLYMCCAGLENMVIIVPTQIFKQVSHSFLQTKYIHLLTDLPHVSAFAIGLYPLHVLAIGANCWVMLYIVHWLPFLSSAAQLSSHLWIHDPVSDAAIPSCFQVAKPMQSCFSNLFSDFFPLPIYPVSHHFSICLIKWLKVSIAACSSLYTPTSVPLFFSMSMSQLHTPSLA